MVEMYFMFNCAPFNRILRLRKYIRKLIFNIPQENVTSILRLCRTKTSGCFQIVHSSTIHLGILSPYSLTCKLCQINNLAIPIHFTFSRWLGCGNLPVMCSVPHACCRPRIRTTNTRMKNRWNYTTRALMYNSNATLRPMYCGIYLSQPCHTKHNINRGWQDMKIY